jgi:Helix-turn-helix.
MRNIKHTNKQDWLKKIGANIKRERELAKLSQSQLMERIGRSAESYRVLGRWEKGTAEPQFSDMLALCIVFDCELGYLLGEHDCKTQAATDVQKETGLSESAIRVLSRRLEEGVIFSTTLSKMIEHPMFYYLVFDLAVWSHRLNKASETEGRCLEKVSSYAREIAPWGFAVLTQEDAAEYYLQKAKDNLREIAHDIWKSRGEE